MYQINMNFCFLRLIKYVNHMILWRSLCDPLHVQSLSISCRNGNIASPRFSGKHTHFRIKFGFRRILSHKNLRDV